MTSDYGDQIKAFFHFVFKHLFETEFGFRVTVEVTLFLLLLYLAFKITYSIAKKVFEYISTAMQFLNKELFTPLKVRLYEKTALETNNPNWQERANRVKENFKRRDTTKIKSSTKKNRSGWWIFSWVVLVSWLLGFHYFGNTKRETYTVFFQPESIILSAEDYLVNTLCSTDETAFKCFFHDEIEID